MYGHTNVSTFHFQAALIAHPCVCVDRKAVLVSEHESLKTASLSQNGGHGKLSARLYLRNLALILARLSNISFSDSPTTDRHEQRRDRQITEETRGT